MANLVNLRAARKAQGREKARAKADENAVKFGRTKGQRLREAADSARTKADLDGKQRDQT
jgi:hypothetical protein